MSDRVTAVRRAVSLGEVAEGPTSRRAPDMGSTAMTRVASRRADAGIEATASLDPGALEAEPPRALTHAASGSLRAANKKHDYDEEADE